MYQPNFADKRIQRRLRHALGFTRAILSETKPHAWSTRFIDEYLGQQQTELSKYLRKHLLVCTREHYKSDSGVCKEYILNKNGWDYLKSQLSNTHYNTTLVYNISDQELVKSAFVDKHQQEFAKLDFSYTDKSNRLWHPLQNISSKYRSELFHSQGFKYQYDIECAAPTLIYQYSRRLGNDVYSPTLDDYIKNKRLRRQELALRADIPTDIAKRIINALFAGAYISQSPTTEINKLLQSDRARIEFLKQDPWLVALRQEIKECWFFIKDTLPRKEITDIRGHKRLLPISSKQKWGVYFDLERQVINAVRTYLSNTSNACFLEHDGWFSQKEINIQQLQEYITATTGYVVNISGQEIKNFI